MARNLSRSSYVMLTAMLWTCAADIAAATALNIPALPPLPQKHSVSAQKLLDAGLASININKGTAPAASLARTNAPSGTPQDALDKIRTEMDEQVNSVREAASSSASGGGSCPT